MQTCLPRRAVALRMLTRNACFRPLAEYKVHNAEVLFREDASVDDLIDVIEGASSRSESRVVQAVSCD